MDTDTAVDIVAIDWAQSPVDSSTRDSHVSTFSVVGVEVHGLPVPLVIRLPHTDSRDGVVPSPIHNVSVVCSPGQQENITLKCPFASFVHPCTIPASSSLANTTVYECPPLHLQGGCEFWDEDLLQWSGAGCRIVNVTETYTECECDHLSHFSSTLSLVAGDFVTIMGTADDITLDDLERNWVVVTTMICLYSFSALYCLYGAHRDRIGRQRREAAFSPKKKDPKLLKYVCLSLSLSCCDML